MNQQELFDIAQESNHDLAWREVMRSLSLQEQKIVMTMYDLVRANVKTIASRSFLTEQSTSSTLGRLKTLGLMSKERFGRESFYSINLKGLIEYLQNNDRREK